MSHTPGPWKIIDDEYISFTEDRIVITDDFQDFGICEVRGAPRAHVRANALLISVAPELLTELKLANRIIINALNVMTPEQKHAWDELNTHDGLKDGWALTRNSAREAVIAKAEGK